MEDYFYTIALAKTEDYFYTIALVKIEDLFLHNCFSEDRRLFFFLGREGLSYYPRGKMDLVIRRSSQDQWAARP